MASPNYDVYAVNDALGAKLPPFTGTDTLGNVARYSDDELQRQLTELSNAGYAGNLSDIEKNYYSDLQAEQKARTTKKAGGITDLITGIIKGNNGPTPTSSGFQTGPTSSAYSSIIDRIGQSVDKSRENVNKQYDASIQSGVQGINNSLAPVRSKLIAEQAALGRLGSGVASYNINQFEQGRQNSIGNLISGLTAEKSRALLAIEEDLRKSLLSGAISQDEYNLKMQSLQLQAQSLDQSQKSDLAKLILGAIQGEQNYGLDLRKTQNMELNTAQEQLRYNQERDLARQLGLAQAEASKPSLASTVLQGIGTIGGLAANLYGGNFGGITQTLANSAQKNLNSSQFQYPSDYLTA